MYNHFIVSEQLSCAKLIFLGLKEIFRNLLTEYKQISCPSFINIIYKLCVYKSFMSNYICYVWIIIYMYAKADSKK